MSEHGAPDGGGKPHARVCSAQRYTLVLPGRVDTTQPVQDTNGAEGRGCLACRNTARTAMGFLLVRPCLVSCRAVSCRRGPACVQGCVLGHRFRQCLWQLVPVRCVRCRRSGSTGSPPACVCGAFVVLCLHVRPHVVTAWQFWGGGSGGRGRGGSWLACEGNGVLGWHARFGMTA